MKITKSTPAILAGLLLILASALNAAAATFVVTNTNDLGPGSLRQAVVSANATTLADTIVFDPAVFSTPQTITLASSINISPGSSADTLTILGPGADRLTLNGNTATRHFETSAFDTISISDMTLTGGNASGGGSIYTRANLTLSNVVFRQNNSMNMGGAIRASGPGTLQTGGILKIFNCQFTNNTATGVGGAIDIESGNVTVSGWGLLASGVTFSGNTSASNGGAIRNNGVMSISFAAFVDNTAGGTGGVGTAGGGGAIYSSGSLTVTACSFERNTAGGNTSGGALVNEGQMTVIRTLVDSNTATFNGGGISHTATNTSDFLRITDSTINGNVANAGVDTQGDGGGIFATVPFTITRSTISHNTARNSHLTSETQGDGGGIYADGGLTMESCTVSENHAAQHFGGIRIQHNFYDSTVTNSTIAFNTAALTGGGIGRDDCQLSCRQLSIGNTIIARNTATTERDIRNRRVHTATTPITSLGYNLVGGTDNAYMPLTSTDLIGDPNLGLLQFRGGPTATHSLNNGSPAIDRGKKVGVPPGGLPPLTDQRGLKRTHDYVPIPNAAGGDGSDIGAYEEQPTNTLPGGAIVSRAPADDAGVTFASVSQEGFTSFTPLDPPSAVGQAPQGYTILDNAPAYDITTTATFTPPLIVSFTVASITTPAEFARVRILHAENGQLIDRTILAPDSPAPDFGTRTVHARVNSLSPFVIALAPSVQLLNVSTRLRVQTGDNALIGGFIISGTASKRVIVRAIGPSLTAFGIPGALTNPVLTLNGPAGFTAITNDDWRDTQRVEIETAVPPTHNSESAIVATLEPGAYTAVVRGQGDGTGVGLVEAYDLEPAVDAKLANISTRGFVETGENVMIGGLIAGPSSSASTQMLVRAIGPSLSAFGVPGALQDPSLELRDGNGALLAANDDWRETQQTVIEATQLAPSHPKEAAILAPLTPGSYTAIVRGVGNTTGVALVEVYNLP